MNAQLQTLVAYWQSRAPRERLFLLALCIFLILALLLNGLWHASQERARLQRQLPQLRLQLATMQQQAADIRSLQNQPAKPALTETDLRQTASALLRQAGLKLNDNQLQTTGARQLRLQVELPFEQWLEAVALLQRDALLRLTQTRIEATGSAGVVRIDAWFNLPEPA